MEAEETALPGDSIVSTALKRALSLVDDRLVVMERLSSRARADGHIRTAAAFEAELLKCERLRGTIEYALSIIPVGCTVCRSEQAGSNYDV